MARETKAIVIGGSMAGMMTARVLSERFDKVVIIERDNIPDEPVARNGVPQGRHLHALLAKGQEIMEDLFPGLSDDLSATGAPILKWGWNGLFVSAGGHSQKFDSGIRSHLTSRVSLEYLVRQRLMQIENIEYMMRTQVNHLIEDSGRITGIEVMHRGTKDEETLHADLVVDASGRGSKTPEWLQESGYEAPEETHVNAFVGYATRWFDVPETYQPELCSIAIGPDLGAGNTRAGAMFFVEGNQAVVTLQGTNKDYPPTDDEGYLAFAKSLQAPYLYDFIKEAKPISPISGYQRTKNRIRHYEKLRRRPENFIVMGDAYCCFNPVYGQGMTTAALEADTLRELLKRYSVNHLDGFAANFQKAISKVIQSPWMMATSEDLRYPDTEGEATLMIRIMQHYSGWLTETAAHDRVLSLAFFKMMNLQTEGTALLKPEIIGRAIWHKFIRPKPRRELEKPVNFSLELSQSQA